MLILLQWISLSGVCVCLRRLLSRAVLRQCGSFLLSVSCMRSPVLSSSRPIRNKTRWHKRTNTSSKMTRCTVSRSVAMVTFLRLSPPAEHHPGLEEELWDREADHGIPRKLPSTGCDRRGKQRPLRVNSGRRTIHLPGGSSMSDLLSRVFVFVNLNINMWNMSLWNLLFSIWTATCASWPSSSRRPASTWSGTGPKSSGSAWCRGQMSVNLTARYEKQLCKWNPRPWTFVCD